MKIFLRANRRRSNGEQPGTKSGHRHAVKPLVNWSPTGLLPVVVFFGSVYMGFNPIVVPKVEPPVFGMPTEPCPIVTSTPIVEEKPDWGPAGTDAIIAVETSPPASGAFMSDLQIQRTISSIVITTSSQTQRMKSKMKTCMVI